MDVFYMPNDNKLYLCFEYCEFDLKKYMKSQQYKLSAACIQVRARAGRRARARAPRRSLSAPRASPPTGGASTSVDRSRLASFPPRSRSRTRCSPA